MAEKKKILYIVEAMGGGVFTYIVDLTNELVDTYDMYIAYAVRKQTPSNYKDYASRLDLKFRSTFTFITRKMDGRSNWLKRTQKPLKKNSLWQGILPCA